MSTDDFRTPTTVVRVPGKKARKSYLDVFGQRNADQADQDHVGNPSDLGPAALIPDNYNGRTKNNGPNQEINTDDFRTPTTIVRVPKKARKSYLDFFGQQNADQANQDREGDPSDLGPTVLLSDNYNGRSKNNRPMYADLLMRKRVILSNDVRKTTLVKHDERPNESNTERDIDDDQTFYENLKKRINKDLQKNILQKTPNPLPRRLSKTKKCKSFLNNDTRNLMNKFREEFANSQSQKLLSQENGVFSIARRSNSSTREEHPHPALPQRVVKREMTTDIMLEHRETEDDSLRGTPSYHEIHAESYNHQPTPPSLEKNRVFSMERQSHSWTGENISEHPHSAMPQNVVERGMTKGISMKYFETDEDSLRSRSPFNEIHAEAHKRQGTFSSSERNGVPSMKRRDNSWTGENICKHPHQIMPQRVVERRMTKDISMNYFETDEDSFRDRQPFNEIHVETHNRQPTPSPSDKSGSFSMVRRSSSLTRGNIREHPRGTLQQSVMEQKPMKDIVWERCGTDEDSLCSTLPFNGIDTEAFNRQPTPPLLERNGAFLMERRSNNSTRESIYEHPQPTMAQNVVERGPTKDIMFEYFEADKDSLHGTPSFNEIYTEAYDSQSTSSSTGSNTFLKYYTKKYYQK